MIHKLLYRKIAVASSILLIILMLSIIPSNNKEIIIKDQQLEYTYPNNLEEIYLLDNNNYLTRMTININEDDIIAKSTDILEILTTNGKKKNIIHTGFKTLLPENTEVLNLELKDEILTINFSKEFKNVSEQYEEKLIESLVYTLTSIDGIKKIQIFVDSIPLTNLPNSKKSLPEYLDKSYGINKKYELTSLNDIYSYTIYYVSNYQNELYYVPVTKYISNDNQDKVKVIIDELATSLTYEPNLMSYLNSNVKLLDYDYKDDIIKLNFNNLILSNITDNLILEEVMYTIGLSLFDELEVKEVVFLSEGNEITTFSHKMLD